MSSSRNRVKQQKRKPRKAKDAQAAAGGQIVSIRNPAASSIIVPLVYMDPDFIYGNNLSTLWSKRWVMNSAYDPDPSIGGGSCTYFAQYAAMYRRYRVIKFTYDVEFVNQTESGVVASVCPTKEDLGNNYSLCINFGESVGGKSRMVSAAGGMNKVHFKGVIDLPSFTGHKGYLYDDVTAALVSATPSQTAYFNVAANSNLTQTASSFAVRTRLVYLTVFFDRLSPFA